MIQSRSRFSFFGRCARAASSALPVCAGLLVLSGSLFAKPVPENLGYGLDKLVASRLALQSSGGGKGKVGTQAITVNGVQYADAVAAEIASRSISSPDGRVLVDVTLSGLKGLREVNKLIGGSVPSFTVTATDAAYRGVGIIEGYVSVDEVAALANVKGVRAVILGLKPETSRVQNPGDQVVEGPVAKRGAAPEVVVGGTLTKLGTSFDQGVVQHRIDFINKFYNPSATVATSIDGTGISVGAMSDSFDTRQSGQTAATNVTNFDLPGAANNPAGNTTPVNVLKDETGAGTDEGRGMVQNIHKMAPRARLAYATGVDGEVAFGNYIRAMANIPGYETTFNTATITTPFNGFKADVICDDISYGGEPFYGESIIGLAIDDAFAAGVSYFSSAGNNIGINAYDSALRIVPNGTGLTATGGNTALANTNINLTGVPAALYAGGFHNFNPDGQDVACRWNIPAATTASTEMQWDDPYDIRTPNLIQPPIFSGAGTTNGTFTVALTQGNAYVIQETATSGNFDGIVTITDPSGNVVVSQDTGTDETVTFFAPASGNFTVTVAPFSTTTGNFTLVVNRSTATLLLTTDLNLLVFDLNGNYLSTKSLTTNNFANNRPVELGTVNAGTGTQTQFVIARASTPATGQRLPTRVRVSTRGNGAGGIGPDEYFTYNATTTKGHATARGCNGTAAYSVFRPNLPETFTSPGPATIFFDKNSNLLASPEIRLCPTVAAIDAANTSDFASDSTSDPDSNPNFSGTSSAAPHAAAIAALVLQAKGGPGSVTPTQMRSILQRSAFPHDLDPSYATAAARTSNGGKVSVTILSDGYNGTNVSTAQNDPNSFAVTYVGPGSITSLVFNPGGTGATGGNVTGGVNGEFDTNGLATSPTVTYFQTDQPGLVFLPGTKAFTLGNSAGLTATDVTVPTVANLGFTNAAGTPTPAATGYYTMTLNFPTAAFTGGKVLRFTVGRGAQRSANTGNGGNVIGVGSTTVNSLADLFGGGVMIPGSYNSGAGTYTVLTEGMTFQGTTSGGGTFSGVIRNRIGAGYSNVDGYGLINAEAAVSLPIQ